MVAEAFAALLKHNFDVIETVQDGRVLIEEAIRNKPGVIVTDVFLPVLNGIDAARQLKGRAEDFKFIFLTMERDPKLAAEAFRAGALGYVSKDSAAHELIHAIEEALHSRSYVTPLVSKDTLDQILNTPHRNRSIEPQLTRRQREVLQLIAEGRTMKEVADILRISTRTAETHKYETMDVLNVHTTAELTQWAIRIGLVSIM